MLKLHSVHSIHSVHLVHSVHSTHSMHSIHSIQWVQSVRVTFLAAIALLAVLCLQPAALAYDGKDPLPSWNKGAAKKAILEFVRETTRKGSRNFVPPEDRIATFDQDGTMWVEQPIYTEFVFSLDRVKALAPLHPEWKTEEPFASLLSGGEAELGKLDMPAILKILAVTHGDMTDEQFTAVVQKWLDKSKHPRFKKPYTKLTYEPMQEVMRYFRANGFQTYLVTGGGQDFVRAFADKTYDVPPQQVIGTMGKTKFEFKSEKVSDVMKEPEMMLVCDHDGKPRAIHVVIGKRPVAAFGNSVGDQQMLEYTQGGKGKRLMMLVHHDDAAREYAYGPESHIGTFTDDLMKQAKQSGWIVISMKKDWKRIFTTR